MSPRRDTKRHERTVRILERATGKLATAAITRMEDELPWYRGMPPEQRSWVGLVIQAGIAAFVDWYRNPEPSRPTPTADVFGTAPRDLIRSISLQQAVEIVRLTIEVVEDNVAHEVGEDDAPAVLEGVLRYSREVAFSAAHVYARYAEARGSWDARLEATVIDSLLRGEVDEGVRSRASALGWTAQSGVTVAIGRPPADIDNTVDDIRRSARKAGYDVLTGVQGDRLVAVLGHVEDPVKAASCLVSHFGTGPVVVGPLVPDLVSADVSARAAVSALLAARGWPDAPRPAPASALLPERALAGDQHAAQELVNEVYVPVAEAGPVILETLAAYLESGASVEAAARLLFVHPNTVRYRLRRVTDVAGLTPTEPRDAFTLRLALTLGRLDSPQVD
ncbi:PucR family transcriptional regulator [Actinobacteria bacterium YIM 96077]|uniref:PucR family transcriptional regulator n=1 Tax=Phytoactinopolyspora halophila TaxID=1981511 RepID=A0A329QTH0_9ACTN|nr:helix-turn-helix domain-containing protein [Phytoactinopolyspora halophila]AYY15562.1 PucR family transcriptional regulator [Actinobacteria bacterium YIM 96077]RAW15714.1 PucR family transcriptional regulator [Phytoactinopolyspora halophila]